MAGIAATAARPTACCTCSPSRARRASTLTLDELAAVAARTPVIASLAPGGRYVAEDLHRAGGRRA